MKYSDLIHFEPVDSIVQLREATEVDYAYNLLDTYVISDRMAELINEIIVEQLQFSRPADNKGILVVGNYGTGKSHLMSVIATIAEFDGSSDRITNEKVAEKSKDIEGKFKVIRSEIGATTMSLRDFVCGELRDSLEEMGVGFSFPTIDQVRSNKDSFVEMMAKFHEVYPDKGLLLVVDELLDYLRSRKEQEVILDLGFLRELGEICRFTNFRFIAGVQEMLFDNPKFQFVAEQLRRVKERFEQVSIVREDIAYVVSQRLLKKDEKQKAIIREHLQKFTCLYDKLNERLEEYVELFPIHPAYLSTFERVIVAEKRVILKTISNEMKKLLSQEVPTDKPGLISYDSYWQYIEGDTSLKSNPDIREVMQKSRILQDRIQSAFTKPLYKSIALRIVYALSVNRLTTGDIYAKLGATSEELRDGLFLYIDLPEPDGEFLRTTIETVLKEILKTVSWQYISFNEVNGQYYIDINKDIAVDDLIEQKSETLTGNQLDRYYYQVLEQLTNRSKDTYVSGYKIWPYELPWSTCKVTRQGYLFFGAPNDRSSVEPERDFYIYILQLFDVPKFKNENKPDEVFLKLKAIDELFIRTLKLYAGSKEMATTAASGTKALYEQRATEHLQQITRWLRENFLSAFELNYKGVTKEVANWTKALPPHSSVEEIINYVSSSCLSESFEEKYPEYPHFTKLNTTLTKDNLLNYVQDANKYFVGNQTKSGTAILDGFIMIKDDELCIDNSGYAKWINELLDNKGSGQVVNRSEIIETIFTMQGTQDLELTRKFSIEPELFSVVLVGLVYSGDIVLTINGTQYDAMKLEQLVKLPITDLINFSHIKRPSGLNMPALKALFNLFRIQEYKLQTQNLQSGVVQLNEEVTKLLNEVVTIMQTVKQGIPCWDGVVLSVTEQQQNNEILGKLKVFLEGLLVFNTPAKLTNFKYTVEEIQEQKLAIDRLNKIKRIQQRINETTSLANYMINATQHLPNSHEWNEEATAALEDLLYSIKTEDGYQVELRKVQTLKEKYKDIYMEFHSRVRLSASEDNTKNALLNGDKLAALQKLATIELLPKAHLETFIRELTSFKTCWSLTKDKLESQPYCPSCRFRPKDELIHNNINLSKFDERLEEMLEKWTQLLLQNFKDPEIKANISLLNVGQQDLVNILLMNEVFSLPINSKLIEAIKLILQGIEKIEIKLDDLKSLMGNGTPITVEETRLRFEKLLKEKVGSNQSSRVRIMLQHD